MRFDVRRVFGATAAERAFRLAVLAALLLGLWLRVWGYAIDPPSFWLDEAYWAVRTITTPPADAQIRPVGFMQVTSWLVRLFGAHVAVYRLLPFAASVASLFAMPFVASQLFKSRWAILVATALFALHPVALEMSVEFKHYSVEIGIYTLLLAAYLYYRRSPSLWLFGCLLFGAWFSFLFSLTVIFAYPTLFALLGWEAISRRNWRRLAAVGVAAALCVGTILAVYFVTWQKIRAERAERKWGSAYDVFYFEKKQKERTRSEWAVLKYFDAAAIPGVGRSRWESRALSAGTLDKLRTADRLAWCALHVGGLLYLFWRKRGTALLWLWLPFLWVLFFNLVGRWPAGAFRTNSFLIPYSILLASFSIEWLGEIRTRARFLSPALAMLVLLPALYFRPLWHKKGLWTAPGAFPEALAILHSGKIRTLPPARATDRQIVLLDNGSCKQWKYYVYYDRALDKSIAPELRRRLRPVCRRSSAALARTLRAHVKTEKERGFWVVLSDPEKYDSLQQAAVQRCSQLETELVRGGTNLVLRCIGAPPVDKKE